MLERKQVSELLLDQVADHALGLGAEQVERVRLDLLVGRALEGEQADLRPVAVRDHELVLERERGERLAGSPRVRALVLGRERLASPEQRVPAECDDDAHRQLPSVATMTALIVCSRFSASSKTSEAGDSKTSSVTSSAVQPELLEDLLPDLRLGVVERRQAVHELHVRVAGQRHRLGVHLVGQEQLDALRPDLVGLAHRDPDVGEQDVAALRPPRRRRR